jgi:hydroxypyruvate isomerase
MDPEATASSSEKMCLFKWITSGYPPTVRAEHKDVTAILRDHFDRIGHIQIADCPGRHQPGTGKTDFKFLLPEIDRMGFRGFVSLEYIPAPDTLSSLQWLPAHGYRL